MSKSINEWREVWERFGDNFGWTLHGWNLGYCASYSCGLETIIITKPFRESIEKYITKNVAGG
jgi:hypothetical protein